MRIIDGMVLTPMGDDFVAVATGSATEVLHGIVRLNGTGHQIWLAIDEGLDEDQIVERFLELYEVDEPTARAAIQRTIAKLRDAGLVVD